MRMGLGLLVEMGLIIRNDGDIRKLNHQLIGCSSGEEMELVLNR